MNLLGLIPLASGAVAVVGVLSGVVEISNSTFGLIASTLLITLGLVLLLEQKLPRK